MRKPLFIVLLALVAVVSSASVWIAVDAMLFLRSKPEPKPTPVIFFIEPGESFDEIAKDLDAFNVITDPFRFKILARMKGYMTRMRAGEYELNTSMLPLNVLQTLSSGQELLHRMQVREGLTWWETARIAEKAGMGTFESFENATKDRDLLQKHNIPAETAEGYLFPETYNLPRRNDNDARRTVEAMLQQFNRTIADIWKSRPAPKELHKLVILASLVEKETGDPSERARIAGVYANRLRKGMLLQCDPTVIYGLGTAFDGNIRKSHLLDKSNPYNTYRHRGLPPGPICSPGADALKAAANPEQHGYLYFVSKKNGTHYFSRNLKEHNAAVRKYQLRR